MLKRILIAIVAVVLISGLAGAWIWWHAVPRPIGEAYVGAGDVPLWDGNGQVRRRLAKLAFGDKVTVLDQYNDETEVRTSNGVVGWVSQDGLIHPDVWIRLGRLAVHVRSMVTQAQGHTSVVSNLRLEPGRTAPRIGQLPRNTPVDILSRGVATRPGAANDGQPRKEDWLLIRARTQAMGQIAGWVLGRFIADDPPEPLPQYATSAGMNPVAWFPLREVIDPSGPKPNYLMAGTQGPEGQPCDFTMLRVYTWSVPHQRYETAFVQNDVCGILPITVTMVNNPHRDVLFKFQSIDPTAKGIEIYRMRDTIVRQLPTKQADELAQSRP